MKRLLSLSVVLCGVAVAALYLTHRDGGRAAQAGAFYAAASPENPAARAQYEWQMLRNPATGRIPRDIRRQEIAFARALQRRSSGEKSVRKIAAQSWVRRGPMNVGGRTRALAVDVSDPKRLLAGGVSGGMWLSTNTGQSWTKVTPSDLLHSVTAVAQDRRPGRTNTWYYGTGELLGNSAGSGSANFRGDGIFKSTNGGATWQRLPATTSNTPQFLDNPFDFVWRLATDAANFGQDVVYAATLGTIQYSNDGGASWNTVLGEFSNNGPIFTDIAVGSNGVAYAALGQISLSGETASASGIFRSTNGIDWTDITPATMPAIYRRIVLAIAPSNENVVYFLMETPGGGVLEHSLFKYTHAEGGGTWEDRSANIPSFGQDDLGNFDSQSSYDLVIAVKPDDENTVFIGGTSLYRSTDGFSTTQNTSWIGGYARNNPLPIYENHWVDQHAIAFSPADPAVMYTGNDGGVFRTNNNTAGSVVWSSLANGYLTSQFYAIAIDPGTPGDPSIIGGLQDRGLWFTEDMSDQMPWTVVPISGDGAFCASANGGNPVYVSVQEGATYRLSETPGTGNLIITRVDPDSGSGYLFINPFMLDPNDNNIMYMLGGDRIWRNDNLAAIPLTFSDTPTMLNWSELTGTVMPGSALTALAVSTVPANRLYYGTADGQVLRLDGANQGDPAPADITGPNLPAGYISCLAIDPQDADRVLLVFSNYGIPSLYFTANGGLSWADVSGNLEQFPGGAGSGPSARWAAIMRLNGQPAFFVGTSTGLYSTSTLGGSATVWALEGAETIGNVVVTMLATRAADNYLAVATHGAGVYSATIKVTGIDEESAASAGGGRTFQLFANYPNPFNPGTSIRYALDRNTRVSLAVFDINGRLVRQLVTNKEQAAGQHSISWDGTDAEGRQAASGVYIYRLSAGTFSQTQRMTLLR